MKCGVRTYFAGTVLLLALASCGRSFLHGERAAWRHDAEVTCLKSGAVKIGVGVEQMQPIAGPGMCGADFPLKVALLGEGTAMSYADDLRPPAGIPNALPGADAELAADRAALLRAAGSGAGLSKVRRSKVGNMRWVPGPPGIARPDTTAPADYAPSEDRYPPARSVDRYPPRPPRRRPASRCRSMRRASRSPTIFPTTPCCRAAAPRPCLSAHAAGL